LNIQISIEQLIIIIYLILFLIVLILLIVVPAHYFELKHIETAFSTGIFLIVFVEQLIKNKNIDARLISLPIIIGIIIGSIVITFLTIIIPPIYKFLYKFQFLLIIISILCPIILKGKNILKGKKLPQYITWIIILITVFALVFLYNRARKLNGEVVISETERVGETLIANTDKLGGSGDIFYQWKREDMNVGKDKKTYKLTVDDVGKNITVTVTRFDNFRSVTSDPLFIVERAPPPSPPPVPLIRTVKVGIDSINLSWDSVGSGYTYQVHHHPQDNPVETIITVNGTLTEITGLNSNTEYFLWVTSVQGGREREKSLELTVTTPPAPPPPLPPPRQPAIILTPTTQTSATQTSTTQTSATQTPATQTPTTQTLTTLPPVPVHVREVTVDTDRITLSWDSAGVGLAYRVYYHKKDEPSTMTIKTVYDTMTDITGLTSDTEYSFWVTSVQGDLESEKSLELPVKTSQAVQSSINEPPTTQRQETQQPAAQQQEEQHPADPPLPPIVLTFVIPPEPDSVTLNWNNVGSGISYIVYFSEKDDLSQVKTWEETTKTTSTVNGLEGDRFYYFWVLLKQDKPENNKSLNGLRVRTAPERPD